MSMEFEANLDRFQSRKYTYEYTEHLVTLTLW